VDRLEAQGKIEEAVHVLQEILTDGPDYRAYVGLGRLLSRLGDLDGAERALEEAIKLTPSNAKAYHYLSPIYLVRGDQHQRQGSNQKARQEHHRAVETADKALAQKPDDAETLVFRGQALQRLGQKVEAIATFRAAVECGPELVEPHFYLAEALTEAGHADEARVHWQRVVLLAKPDNPRRRLALERLKD
jgi:Flp pilus assembly protein TadD